MTTRAEVDATVDGDWVRCGAFGCHTRFALGVAPVRSDARIKCPNCRTWNALPIAKAKE